MLKALKSAVLTCSLLITLGQQAHAAWQGMNPGDAIPVGAIPLYLSHITWLYTCRAAYAGGMHPGWTSASKGSCSFGWGGLEQTVSPYEIWVDDWQTAVDGAIPANAIAFGEEAQLEGGYYIAKPRYICQAVDPDGGVAIGKVAPEFGACYFPWGGYEIHQPYYRVLVDSSINMVDSAGGPKRLSMPKTPPRCRPSGPTLFSRIPRLYRYLGPAGCWIRGRRQPEADRLLPIL